MTASSAWRDGVVSGNDSVTYAKSRHYAIIGPAASPIGELNSAEGKRSPRYSSSHSTPSNSRTKSAPYADDGVWYPALKSPLSARTPIATTVFAVNP